MKLESLKSEKFMPLSFNAMQQIRGGDKETQSGRATVNGKTFDFHHDNICGNAGECTEYYNECNELIKVFEG